VVYVVGGTKILLVGDQPAIDQFIITHPDDDHQRPPRIVVLDMDSSESPTYGEQEGAAYNGHFGCTCYHPLFVFNSHCPPHRAQPNSSPRHPVGGGAVVSHP
jgi:Transposase DDE domain group 1